MEWWQIGTVANVVVAIAYLGIATAIFRPLARAGQLTTNRLGTATGLIFVTCAVHHGLHPAHMLLPYLGAEETQGLATRASFDWHQGTWDVLTAGVGIYYWTLRRSYGRLLEGGTLFDSLQRKHREAVEINDSVLQSLVAAQMARRLHRDEEADAAVEKALAATRQVVGRLLADATGPSGGAFVRDDVAARRPL